MKYRLLGKTGLQVSEIAFGCGNVGGLLIRGTLKEQIAAVARALELGINYFDTAEGYGDGQSETNLGRVLAELRPQVSVATKVRLGDDDLKDIKGAVRRSLEASLKRLQRDSVDVLQLHTQLAMERGGAGWQRAISPDDVLGEDGVADAFDSVRSQGLVRFLGFTGLGETEALHQIIQSGRFDLVQAYYNLLNPSAGVSVPSGFTSYDFGQLIDRATEQGMGVAAIRTLAGGALAGKASRTGYAAPTVAGPMVPGGKYQTDEARADKLNFLVAGDIPGLSQAALRFALMHPGVSMVVVGFSNEDQVEEAAACSGKGPLPEPTVERLRELWATDFGIEHA